MENKMSNIKVKIILFKSQGKSKKKKVYNLKLFHKKNPEILKFQDFEVPSGFEPL